jgi:hypothetical protein
LKQTTTVTTLTPYEKNLAGKLGINSGFFIISINQPDNYFGTLKDLPHGVRFLSVEDNVPVDALHIFAKTQSELIHELFISKPLLKENGKIWIFYPKKAARIKTDLDMNFIIGFGQDIHLVNVQLIDFDYIWTGIEFQVKNYE